MNPETLDGPASCRSVRNAFRLLEILAVSPDGLRLARLVDATGLPKSSVHRILATLEDLEIVCRDDATANYHLTASWRRIVVPPRPSEFTAPVFGQDGSPVAGLTLRLRGHVAPGMASERLGRLVGDLAHAVSRRISGLGFARAGGATGVDPRAGGGPRSRAGANSGGPRVGDVSGGGPRVRAGGHDRGSVHGGGGGVHGRGGVGGPPGGGRAEGVSEGVDAPDDDADRDAHRGDRIGDRMAPASRAS